MCELYSGKKIENIHKLVGALFFALLYLRCMALPKIESSLIEKNLLLKEQILSCESRPPIDKTSKSENERVASHKS